MRLRKSRSTRRTKGAMLTLLSAVLLCAGGWLAAQPAVASHVQAPVHRAQGHISNAQLWSHSSGMVRMRLPVVSVRTDNVTNLRPIAIPSYLSLSVPKNAATNLAIYVVGIYTFLGPREWKPGNAVISEDGGVGLTLTNPHMQGEFIQYSLTPACVGCAVDAAAGLFTAAAKQAPNYGIERPVVPMSRKGYQVSAVLPNTRLYSRPFSKNWFAAGLLTWRNPAPAFSVSMQLPLSMTTVASAVLHAFAQEYCTTPWPVTLPHRVTNRYADLTQADLEAIYADLYLRSVGPVFASTAVQSFASLYAGWVSPTLLAHVPASERSLDAALIHAIIKEQDTKGPWPLLPALPGYRLIHRNLPTGDSVFWWPIGKHWPLLKAPVFHTLSEISVR